jgi:pyruvate-formate lyase-activating enzyme
LRFKLDTAYKQEKGVDVKERILLVRRIIEDKQHIEEVARVTQVQSMGLQVVRYNDDGLDGLKDKARSEVVDLQQMYQKM